MKTFEIGRRTGLMLSLIHISPLGTQSPQADFFRQPVGRRTDWIVHRHLHRGGWALLGLDLGTGHHVLHLRAFDACRLRHARSGARHGRQAFPLPANRPETGAWGISQMNLTNRVKTAIPDDQMRRFVTCPVSYTHLDVYKRQV